MAANTGKNAQWTCNATVRGWIEFWLHLQAIDWSSFQCISGCRYRKLGITRTWNNNRFNRFKLLRGLKHLVSTASTGENMCDSMAWGGVFHHSDGPSVGRCGRELGLKMFNFTSAALLLLLRILEFMAVHGVHAKNCIGVYQISWCRS